jgi:hypothetical protein
MLKLDKIDEDTFVVNDKIVNHFIDGTFYIFKNKYDYFCATRDDYPDNHFKPAIHIDDLYDLFDYIFNK